MGEVRYPTKILSWVKNGFEMFFVVGDVRGATKSGRPCVNIGQFERIRFPLPFLEDKVIVGHREGLGARHKILQVTLEEPEFLR